MSENKGDLLTGDLAKLAADKAKKKSPKFEQLNAAKEAEAKKRWLEENKDDVISGPEDQPKQ